MSSIMCLWSTETGHYFQRRGLIKNLLTDFTKCSMEDLTTEFVYECLPLLFEILKQGKVCHTILNS